MIWGCLAMSRRSDAASWRARFMCSDGPIKVPLPGDGGIVVPDVVSFDQPHPEVQVFAPIAAGLQLLVEASDLLEHGLSNGKWPL